MKRLLIAAALLAAPMPALAWTYQGPVSVTYTEDTNGNCPWFMVPNGSGGFVWVAADPKNAEATLLWQQVEGSLKTGSTLCVETKSEANICSANSPAEPIATQVEELGAGANGQCQ